METDEEMDVESQTDDSLLSEGFSIGGKPEKQEPEKPSAKPALEAKPAESTEKPKESDAQVKPEDSKPKEEQDAQAKLEERSKKLDEDDAGANFWETIKTVFPDAKEIVASKQFDEWLGRQPKSVQAMSNSDTPADGIKVLQMFKGDTGEKKPLPVAESSVSEELKNVKIKLGSGEHDIKWFLSEYEDLGECIVQIANQLAEAKAKKLEPAKQDDETKTVVQSLKTQLDEMRFWSAVQESHGDAKKIANSKEFVDWKTTQSKSIQKLCHTGDPEDAVYVLNAFKEFKNRDEKEKQDKNARAKKDKVAGLHGHTISGKSGKVDQESEKDDEDEFAAGFNHKG